MQIYLNIIAKVGPGPGMQHDWLLLLRWPDRGVEVLATLYTIYYTLYTGQAAPHNCNKEMVEQ